MRVAVVQDEATGIRATVDAMTTRFRLAHGHCDHGRGVHSPLEASRGIGLIGSDVLLFHVSYSRSLT